MTQPAWLSAALYEHYPVLKDMPDALFQEVLERHLRCMELPEGRTLFEEGSPCAGFPLVLQGEVRISRSGANGRSLELYRVNAGGICIVSCACLGSQRPVNARAQTTEPTQLALLNPIGFDRWCGNPGFRTQVLSVMAGRLSELMALVEAVAFQRLDQRLALKLLERGPCVHTTHQALADELGTVREIVTRLLRRFERQGWLSLARERIELLDADALKAFAEPH